MSRGQQGQVFNTASGENSTYNSQAQTSFGTAQQDVGNFASEVGAFKAANPYVQGGTVQTAQNQEIADTAAGQAQSAGQALQSQSVRTGQNAGGAIAATENMEQQNERNLAGQEAGATAQRAAAGTGYGEAVLGGEQTVESMQDQIAQQQAAAAQGALGSEETAAQTPSFLDELGQGAINAGVAFAGGAGKAAGCWIAAELFGGWEDPRTILVRAWMWNDFRGRWYGAPFVDAYMRWGEKIAQAIQTRKRLRWCFQLVFNRALKSARKWSVTRG